MPLKFNEDTSEKFGLKLPTPYVESIEVRNKSLTVQMAIYLRMDQQTFDELSTYLESLRAIKVYTQLLFDRRSNTSKLGICSRNSDGDLDSSTFYTYPVKAFTEVAAGNISPLEVGVSWEGIASRYPLPTPAIDPLRLATRSFLSGETFNLDTDGDGEADGETWTYTTVEADVEPLYVNELTWIGDASLLDFTAEWATKAKSVDAEERAEKGMEAYDWPSSNLGTGGGTDGGSGIQMTKSVYTIWPLGSIADFTHTDTYYPNDGSVVVKLTQDMKVHDDPDESTVGGVTSTIELSAEWRAWARSQFLSDEGKTRRHSRRIGLVSYTSTLDLSVGSTYRNDIRQLYRDKDPERHLMSAKVSPVSAQEFVRNGQVTQQKGFTYRDTNGSTHVDPIATVNGVYYGASPISLSDIWTGFKATIKRPPTSTGSDPFSGGPEFSGPGADLYSNPEPETDAQDLIAVMDNLEMLLLTAGDKDVTLLIKLNKFRQTFPNKSSTTPVGRYYNRFKNLLFQANSAVKQGLKCRKQMVNNPVVKDMRAWTAPATALTDITSTEANRSRILEYIDARDTLWSRKTVVSGYKSTGDDPASLMPNVTRDYTLSHGEDGTTTDYVYFLAGAQYEYTLVDDGYFFFNYEKAIKKFSVISQFIDVNKLEHLFGRNLTNGTFRMIGFRVKSHLYDNEGYFETDIIDFDAVDDAYTGDMGVLPAYDYIDMTDGLVASSTYSTGYFGTPIGRSHQTPIGSLLLQIRNDNGYPENDICVYDYDTVNSVDIVGDGTTTGIDFMQIRVEPSSLTTHAYDTFGGADRQSGVMYSFGALRNFRAISNDSDVTPGFVDTDMVTDTPMYYRLACFQYQKLNPVGWHLDSDTTESEMTAVGRDIELSNNNQYFVPRVWVIDDTYEIYTTLLAKVQALEDLLSDYVSAAQEECAVDSRTGFFNEFFINGVESEYPNEADTPYTRAAVIFHFLQDLIYDTYGGEKMRIYDAVKATIGSIGPRAGTLSALEAFQDRYESLVTVFEEMDDDAALTSTGREIGFGGYSSDADRECMYIPDESYENYPLYPWVYDDTVIELTYDCMYAIEYIKYNIAPSGGSTSLLEWILGTSDSWDCSESSSTFCEHTPGDVTEYFTDVLDDDGSGEPGRATSAAKFEQFCIDLEAAWEADRSEGGVRPTYYVYYGPDTAECDGWSWAEDHVDTGSADLSKACGCCVQEDSGEGDADWEADFDEFEDWWDDGDDPLGGDPSAPAEGTMCGDDDCSGGAGCPVGEDCVWDMGTSTCKCTDEFGGGEDPGGIPDDIGAGDGTGDGDSTGF